jgi:hypothetical protein
MSQLSDVAIAALRSGLEFAQSHLLAGGEEVDADGWHPEDLPLDERDRLLLLLQSARTFSEEDRRLQDGRPPIPADRQTHLLVANLLQQAIPGSHVVGEEATEGEWDAAESAAIGAMIFSLDAIDGSFPYETLTFGYSTNLLAYRREADHDELLFAAVANSSGILMTYEDPASVRVGTFTDLKEISQPLRDDFTESTVAVQGADPQHRSEAGFLLDRRPLRRSQ